MKHLTTVVRAWPIGCATIAGLCLAGAVFVAGDTAPSKEANPDGAATAHNETERHRSGGATYYLDQRTGSDQAPVYDGTMVPMVGGFKDNRRILAGFMGYGACEGDNGGYAGYLVFRELIQHPDGSLGMKWPEEMRPKDGAAIRLDAFVADDGQKLAGPALKLNTKEFTWARSGAPPRRFHLKVRVVPEGTGEFGLGMLGGPVPTYGPKKIGWQLRFLPKSDAVKWETPQRTGPWLRPRT